jgi:hypothetical protein
MRVSTKQAACVDLPPSFTKFGLAGLARNKGDSPSRPSRAATALIGPGGFCENGRCQAQDALFLQGRNARQRGLQPPRTRRYCTVSLWTRRAPTPTPRFNATPSGCGGRQADYPREPTLLPVSTGKPTHPPISPISLAAQLQYLPTRKVTQPTRDIFTVLGRVFLTYRLFCAHPSSATRLSVAAEEGNTGPQQ